MKSVDNQVFFLAIIAICILATAGIVRIKTNNKNMNDIVNREIQVKCCCECKEYNDTKEEGEHD